MSLREQIKTLSGNKRRFFLLRIADLDTKAARKIVGISSGTYNSWFQNPVFVELYRRRSEFSGEYKQEAIQLLRRDNQLEAVLLEGKILAKMKVELEADEIPEHSLIRSNLAREVYSKLISDLDVTPKVQLVSWEQRLLQIFGAPPEQLPEGRVIDGESSELETDSEQETKSDESQTVQESEQTSNTDEEETQA